MKNFIFDFEELWVAVAFAECGEYAALYQGKIQPQRIELSRLNAA